MTYVKTKVNTVCALSHCHYHLYYYIFKYSEAGSHTTGLSVLTAMDSGRRAVRIENTSLNPANPAQLALAHLAFAQEGYPP